VRERARRVKVSALALMKMNAHCKRGGQIEVMGMLQGYALGDAFVVTDAFELPVEGTETRVNAQAEAYEYMVAYTQAFEALGRKEKVVGWYHSHPGYGCWMSGIDVNTQQLNQRHFEPFVAVVIDPLRTSATGKVEIGAFRTYPEGYTPPNEVSTSSKQGVPSNKMEDFGAHANQYYSLEVSFFKSSLDARTLDDLSERYWVNMLDSSPWTTNEKLFESWMTDVEGKLERAEKTALRGGATHERGNPFARTPTSAVNGPDVSALASATHDAVALAMEQSKAFASYAVKRALFDAARTVDARTTDGADDAMRTE
jgi:COP9 signalosome complex subunit 5